MEITIEKIKKLFPEETTIKDTPLACWEEYPFRIVFNYKMSDSGMDSSCKHCYEKDNIVIVPILIIALNEGGCNSTGVCLHCILESVEKTIKEREVK